MLGGKTSIAEMQNSGLEGTGNLDVDGEGRPAAEQEEAVGEPSPTGDGQIDGVQSNEGPSNAESNDARDRQKQNAVLDNNAERGSPGAPIQGSSHDNNGDRQNEPEREASPNDDDPMPRSPRAPSSPPASLTNPGRTSQTPTSPRMNKLDANPAVQDDINANKPSDQLITQGGGLNTTESKTVKRPRPRPVRKQAALEYGLATTRGKRARSGPAPKEILTLAERARQMDRGGGDEPSMGPRANSKGRKGNPSKHGRGKKSGSA